ncbi:hypothetical protein ABK040_009439 [Willaertia magna]
MKTINGHQPLISEYRMHNILTFNYDKTENIFKTIEENNQITSNFTNIINCKSLYSDISETLSYVTKDNKGFVTMEGNKSELIDKEDLIDCEFVNDVFLTRNEVIIKEKVFQLPYLDLNDKFIKIISSSKKSFCFLLTGKVKQHCCGNFHSLYLTFDNEVYGCGLNSSGQFGKQYDTNIYSDCLPLTKITFNNTENEII